VVLYHRHLLSVKPEPTDHHLLTFLLLARYVPDVAKEYMRSVQEAYIDDQPVTDN